MPRPHMPDTAGDQAQHGRWDHLGQQHRADDSGAGSAPRGRLHRPTHHRHYHKVPGASLAFSKGTETPSWPQLAHVEGVLGEEGRGGLALEEPAALTQGVEVEPVVEPRDLPAREERCAGVSAGKTLRRQDAAAPRKSHAVAVQAFRSCIRAKFCVPVSHRPYSTVDTKCIKGMK